MKNTLFALLIAAVICSTTACDQMPGSEAPALPPAELIIGTWKFQKVMVPKEELAKLDDWQRMRFAEEEMQMRVMRYSFFNDGTFSMDGEMAEDLVKNIQRGNYRLINDGQIIVTEPTQTEGKSNKSDELKISLLNTDSLIIGEKTGDAFTGMLFLKVR